MIFSRESQPWTAALEACRALQAEGGSVDDVLYLLRHAGFWKVESIQALRELREMTFLEAKTLVHLSSVWEDQYIPDEQLHDEIARAIETLEHEDKYGEEGT